MFDMDADYKIVNHFLFKHFKKNGGFSSESIEKDNFNNFITTKKRINRLCFVSFIKDLQNKKKNKNFDIKSYNRDNILLCLETIMNVYLSIFNLSLYNRKYLENHDFFLDEEFLLENIEKYIKNEEIILQAISRFLKEGWTVDMLDLITVSILKAGITELMFTDTKGVIVISEYTSMAGGLLVDKKMKFINGLLDNVYNKLCQKE